MKPQDRVDSKEQVKSQGKDEKKDEEVDLVELCKITESFEITAKLKPWDYLPSPHKSLKNGINYGDDE